MAPAASGGAAPSVFVSVGTDHHPFDRLIGWIDDWAAGRAPAGTTTFVQHGTSRAPAVAGGAPYLDHDELDRRMSGAGAIVCHGGPGTIVDALRTGRKPIVVPRRHALGEHVDDHQVRFARRLHASGFIHVADTAEDLASLLDEALSGSPAFAAAQAEDVVRASVARFAEIAGELFRPPPDPVRVLYVGGWGRSGSTLLDRLLGQVPGCCSVGEMRDVWLRGVLENRRCGCGEPFHDCPFWTAVGERAFGGWARQHAEVMHRLRMRFDRPWMVPVVWFRPVRPPGLERYVDAVGRLYRGIRDVSGADVVVDSTKIPSYALVLGRVEGLDLRFVHLVRDARGVVHSWRKSVDRTDATTRPDRMIRYGSASASGRYLLYNGTAGLLRHSRIPYLFERYEDLVADPSERLAEILRFAGLAGAETAFLRDGRATLGPNHSVDGNPMRFTTGELEIRADEEWRRAMDGRDRRMVTVLARPLLRRYGYR